MKFIGEKVKNITSFIFIFGIYSNLSEAYRSDWTATDCLAQGSIVSIYLDRFWFSRLVIHTEMCRIDPHAFPTTDAPRGNLYDLDFDSGRWGIGSIFPTDFMPSLLIIPRNSLFICVWRRGWGGGLTARYQQKVGHEEYKK